MYSQVFENLKKEKLSTSEFCHSRKKKKTFSKLLAGTLLVECNGLMLV